MSLVPSLLQAIVHLDGEALVMHAGDKPYVVTPAGQVDLASRGLTLDAVNGIVSQLLPPEVLRALDEFGAAQHELSPRADFPNEQFTVVAARGGDDVWMEIRRRRISDDDRVPDDMFGPAASAGTGDGSAAVRNVDAFGHDDRVLTQEQMVRDGASLVLSEQAAEDDETLLLPDAEQLWGSSDPAKHPSVPSARSAPPAHRHEPVAARGIRSAPVSSATPHSLELPDAAELWGVDEIDTRLTDAVAPPAPPRLAGQVQPPPPPAAYAEPLSAPTAYAKPLSPSAAHIEPLSPPAAYAQPLSPPAAYAEPLGPARKGHARPPEELRPWAEIPWRGPPAASGLAHDPAAPEITGIVHPSPHAIWLEASQVWGSSDTAESTPEATDSPAASVAPVADEPALRLADEHDLQTAASAVHAHEPASGAAVMPTSGAAPSTHAIWLDAAHLRGRSDSAAPVIEARDASEEPVMPGAPVTTAAPLATHGPAAMPAAEVETPPIVPPVHEPAAGVPMVPSATPAPWLRGKSVDAAQLWGGREMDEPVIHASDVPEVSTAPAVLEPAAMGAVPPAVLSDAPRPAVVLPMARTPARPHRPVPHEDATASGLERLLRLAAARGASTLYVASDARPWVRVDGEIQAFDLEPILSASDVESLLLTIMPERKHDALRSGAPVDWLCELEDVGRVRCMSFRDQRGPGGVFQLLASRAASADQLALWREIQALVIEPEGLVLVAGPRWSGKRTLISAFVDVINRTRRDHVISIESEINIVHERGKSFVSQREVPGTDEDVLAAARAALREDPDVLVIEDVRSGALMNVALEAAASGHLVIGGFSAHSAAGTIDRIIHFYAPEDRPQMQAALAEQLRGVVVQVLLRNNGGGRLPARELLLNTAAVASLIAEGQTSQLPMAIESGRRHGMVTLNDSLAGFVQSGAVEVGEAYRRSADRTGFLSLLKRRGIDASFMERIA
jgi:twitching motility protein PilT